MVGGLLEKYFHGVTSDMPTVPFRWLLRAPDTISIVYTSQNGVFGSREHIFYPIFIP
jgi:hypothetical protein